MQSASTAYSQPLAKLDAPALRDFAAGERAFAERWVAPFVSGGQWGRGPQSNAESCLACHPGNGRGRAPDGPLEHPLSIVLRLAMADTGRFGRPIPHPSYGTQLNRHGVLGTLIEEGDFRIAYRTRRVGLEDGSEVELRTPQVRIAALWFGPLGGNTTLSLRIAPPVFGLGLLEAVPDATLHALAKRQQQLGYKGRVNLVRDESSGQQAIGRFGHKASLATLRQQVAAAFHDEIGVTSPIFPEEQCWPIQEECYRTERLAGIEADDEQLDVLTHYLRMLAPPSQRDREDPQVRYGEKLFESARCAVCHVPELHTGEDAANPALRNRTIRPYTDLLLHDMGAGLADGRREFAAGGRDWRTPALWGIGLRFAAGGNGALLHDGRARDVTEAILWHGGEAKASRRAFLRMKEQDRKALIRFVESL